MWVLLCLAFVFALAFLSFLFVVGSLSLCIRSGVWRAKSAAGTQVQIVFPNRIGRHRRDIGLITVWDGNRIIRKRLRYRMAPASVVPSLDS